MKFKYQKIIQKKLCKLFINFSRGPALHLAKNLTAQLL